MTDNHTLTDADKDRIKEAFHEAFPLSSGSGFNEFYTAAEYATIFERQQENLAYELELAANDILSKEVKRLEAERTELRKPIDEHLLEFIRWSYKTGADEDYAQRILQKFKTK